jgi:hypothetical protein
LTRSYVLLLYLIFVTGFAVGLRGACHQDSGFGLIDVCVVRLC